METRIQKLIAVVGKKGVGKTFLTTQLLIKYLNGNPEAGIPGRRALIFDVNNEYENVRTLPVEYVQAFSVHQQLDIRRIIPFKNNGEKMTTSDLQDNLDHILTNFYGGTLLLEDIKKYTSDNLKKDLIGAICTNRHNNVDLILHYQSFAHIQTKIWDNINVLRFHKCTTKVAAYKASLADKYEILALAEAIVNIKYKTNPRTFVYVDMEEDKIKANPREPDVIEAIDIFIMKNPKETINLFLNNVDKNGKKISRLEATQLAKNEIIETYFD